VNRRRLVGGLAFGVLFSVLVYAALAALTDARAALDAVADFPLLTFGVMLALALGGYTLRGLRWRYYSNLLGHPASPRDALYVYFSGLTMTITPGKVGEVLKAFLARELVGMPMAKGVTLLFIERQADLIAVLVLATGGLSLLPGGWLWIPGALLVVVLATLAISTRWFQAFLLRILSASGWIRRHDESVSAISETMRLTLSLRPLSIAVPMSVVAWGAEGLSFYLCARALGFSGLGLGPAVAIYAASTVAGALAFFPGGIGFTEASLAALLVAAGASGATAAAATVIVRVATLWLGVAAGWVVIATRPALLRGFLRAPEDTPEAAGH
jgi:uncharacterized protein (TIRG00374 family)